MKNEEPELTIVVPFFNEELNVRPLVAELRGVVERLGLNVELILVDDGSRDGTPLELATAAAGWTAVQVSALTENYGQAAALWHGFGAARGRWIAMLDGDGQNPPGELERLWARREEADMIVGVRQHRRDSWLRRAMSRVANAVRSTLLRDGVSDAGCSLKIFRREVMRSFMPVRTLYSFLPAFAVAAGYRVQEVPVAHRPRRAGVSKYGLRTMAVYPLCDMLALAWVLRRAIRRERSEGIYD